MPRHNAHRFAQRDANHEQIADLYMALGCSVYDTSHVGGGFPDLTVGCVGRTALVEIKSATGTATPAQQTFHRDWRGGITIVRSTSDVIAHVKAMRTDCIHHGGSHDRTIKNSHPA